MRVPRIAPVCLVTLLLLLGTVPDALSQDDPFDPVAGVYPYVQPDDAGDAVAEGNPEFGDIIAFSIIDLSNGSLILQMKFVDLAGATGDLRYCAFFTVDGTAYQAGLRGRFINGAPDSSVAVTSCTWGDQGTTVGTPTLDTANDQVRITIGANEIENLAPGAVFESIVVQIGAVVPVAAQGDPELFDSLTPSVEPVDFAYSGSAVVLLLGLDVTWSADNASATPGETAEWSFNVFNAGASDVDVNFTLDGLPEGFNHTFEPNATTVAANASANVTLSMSVPADAEPSTIPLTLMVTSDQFIELLSLELIIEAAKKDNETASPAPTNQTVAALSETAADGTPAPGLIGLSAAVAAAVVMVRRRRA